jgi:hypothetical protein
VQELVILDRTINVKKYYKLNLASKDILIGSMNAKLVPQIRREHHFSHTQLYFKFQSFDHWNDQALLIQLI